MSKTLLFVVLAVAILAGAFASGSTDSESISADVDSTLSEMAAVADSQAILASMQAEVSLAKKGRKGGKATNGVQRLVKMLRKVIRRTRRSLRAAGQNRAAQKKECKRIFTTAKAKTPIAQAEIKTLKVKLAIAVNAIARSKNDLSAFSKKVANAVSEGKRFDALQVTRRGEATLNQKRWTAANTESQALIALLTSIKGNLKANGLAEISSELTDAAHAHAAQETMLLAIAAAAEKGGKKGMNEVHDMLDLLIANLRKDMAANLANIKQGAATVAKLIAELAQSANSARASAKSFLKSRGDVSAAGDRATKNVLAYTVRIKALESKIANTLKRVATTKLRCAASKKRFVGKKARSLKKIRVLKSIIKQLKNHKLSPAMQQKIAGLKLNKAVWSKGAWGACSTKCGLGVKTRAVTCSGKHCKGRKPATKEACTVGACKVACVVSRWTRFSKCAGGVQQRTRKVLVRASNGGKACPSTAGLVHKRGCAAKKKGGKKVKKTKTIKKIVKKVKKVVKKVKQVVKKTVKKVVKKVAAKKVAARRAAPAPRRAARSRRG